MNERGALSRDDRPNLEAGLFQRADGKLELVRASRDALREGPVYVHCHHGKHRSAGAAGTVAVSLGWLTAEKAIERMKVSGTAPNYTGLYQCTAEAMPLGVEVIDRVPAERVTTMTYEGQ